MQTMKKRKQQPNRLSVRSSTRNRTDAPVTTLQGAMNIPLGTALTWMHAATVRLRKLLGGES